jgi:hypothetical protein
VAVVPLVVCLKNLLLWRLALARGPGFPVCDLRPLRGLTAVQSTRTLVARSPLSALPATRGVHVRSMQAGWRLEVAGCRLQVAGGRKVLC